MRPTHQGRYASLVAVIFSILAASCHSIGNDQATETDEDAVSDDTELATRGRQIAVDSCSSCHAIDDERASPRPGAPPLLSILNRYDGNRLANDLIEGVRVGHDEMPQFDFDVRSADALVAYLKSIDRTPRAAER